MKTLNTSQRLFQPLKSSLWKHPLPSKANLLQPKSSRESDRSNTNKKQRVKVKTSDKWEYRDRDKTVAEIMDKGYNIVDDHYFDKMEMLKPEEKDSKTLRITLKKEMLEHETTAQRC